MDITVTQENLTKALTAASRVASTKAQLPILSNILLRTDGNRLLVAATNLEIAMTQYIGAKVASQGAITVPARLVSEFVASLPKDTVHLVAKDNHLTLTSGTYMSVINGVVADEFPELPTIDESSSVHYAIAAGDLKQALTQTIITASSDSTRPVLTGIYWSTSNGNLYLAATDGYRLAERKLATASSDVAAIVPATTLQEVLRTLSDDIDVVDVLVDDTQVRFRVGEAEIISRLIDGKYPDYRQLIPASSETVVTIKTSEFSRLAKIAGLFARESGGSITITVSKDDSTVSLHSIASELGENTSSATADVSADGVITLNSRYLSEALSVIDEDTIAFRFSGKLSACVLSATGKDSDYTHLIMPLKS